MARGELLRKLLISHRRGNDDEFRAVALEVIAEEEKKNNHRLARDLMRIMDNNGLSSKPRSVIPGSSNGIPRDKERQTCLVDVREPKRALSDILLKQDGGAAVSRVLQEYRKAELLRTHGLRPATKLLFCGPPGCGKTLCAEVIAAETGLPLLYTRFDAVVSSYLGETAANLRKVFDFASSSRWVVLFDEFDAIGKARDDHTEHGELKRVVNTFLQLLDSFDSPSIIIAATNHEQLLDPALWRRFDEILTFGRPSVHEIRALLKMKLKNFPRSGIDLKVVASRLKGMSHADVERVCFDSVKLAILEDRNAVDEEIISRAIARQRSRMELIDSAADRRNP